MKDLTMKEYKQKKDMFKNDLINLIAKFNNDTGLAIKDISVDIENMHSVDGDIKFCHASIELITNLDQ